MARQGMSGRGRTYRRRYPRVTRNIKPGASSPNSDNYLESDGFPPLPVQRAGGATGGACRQCGKTWEGVRPQPLLVDGLCLACRHRLREQRLQPRSYWGQIGVFMFLGVVICAIGGLILGGLAWMMLLGLIGLGGGYILGALLAASPEDHTVTLPQPAPRERTGGRAVSLSSSQPSASHAPTLPDHTVTLPPPEQASQARRSLTTTVPARQHNPAKGVTRPGMSTLGRTSKQPLPGSSRAAEKWPPPPRVRQHERARR